MDGDPSLYEKGVTLECYALPDDPDTSAFERLLAAGKRSGRRAGGLMVRYQLVDGAVLIEATVFHDKRRTDATGMVSLDAVDAMNEDPLVIAERRVIEALNRELG